MPGRLAGQVSIITGAGAGIGRAAAELFAEEGSKVVVVDIDEAGGAGTVAGIKEKGGEAVFIKIDVSKEDDCKLLADRVVELYGKIDCLINNAAMYHYYSYLAWIHSESARCYDGRMAKELPKMKIQQSGSIVNLGSISSHIGQPQLACYASTKAAILGLTRNMAVDLAPFNIRVNSLSPGSVFTVASERHAKALNIPIDQFKQEQGALNAMKRMAEPREIAAPLLFLSSKDASFVTGADLLVDGGYTTW